MATLKRGQNLKYLPTAFTEHGALMVANVLNSPQAVKMSVYVVRAFIKQREFILCPARALPRRIPAEWQAPLADGRLLILSGFTDAGKRVTAELATPPVAMATAMGNSLPTSLNSLKIPPESLWKPDFRLSGGACWRWCRTLCKHLISD